MTYVNGIINVGKGQEEEGSSNPPVIIQFYYVQNPDNLNKFRIVFSVKDLSSLSLIKTINGIATSYDVFGKTEWSGDRHKDYDSVFQLKAKNKNSITSSGYITVRRQIIQIDTEIVPLTASFTVSRVADTSSGIVAIVTVNQVEGFEIAYLDEIKLYYRKQGSESWEVFSISTTNPKLTSIGGEISKYDFELSGKNIKRDFIGGYFDFYVEISAKRFGNLSSKIQTILFENIQITPSKKGTQTFPKAEILDQKKPALLRYEIKTKFSEEFVIQSNSKEGDKIKDDDKNQFFLNAEEVAGLKPERPFIYTSAYKDGETKGYMFPACVSEILPCISVTELGQKPENKLVVLFWKINDDFFNYSFLSGQVSIRTDLLVVKVQYKSSGTYTDLTKEITLTQEEHYNPKDNKFVLRILSEDADNASLFNQVKESDNYSDNLRILVVKHQVYCSTSNGPNSPGRFTFDKLLMPHEWKYICYDKFIGANAEARIAENKLSLSLNSPYLRGIRLPEKGFVCFDKLTDILVADHEYASKKWRSDLSVFYKLSSIVEAFYSDPIFKGTINSIELPEIPDDVFLVPPDLEISDPNLIKSGIGSERAQGVVRLNEYGKISSIELSTVGQGYSQYKTIQSEREQSKSDIIPTVYVDYFITNQNLNINRQFLEIKNLSFDRSSLKASLNFGVRLASVSEDIKKASISASQQLKIDKYLKNNFIENVEVENNSVLPYVVTPDQVTPNAARSSDVTWDIILKLYSENISSLNDELTIYNQDLDPGVSEFEDSRNSSLAEPSKDPSAITAISVSILPADYSVFALSDLKIIPDGSPAVSITNRTQGTPWLSILPMSERADGTIGYGALPNMAPRAEMFNRLAIGVNQLNQVRLIVPQVLRVETSTTTTAWYKKDTGIENLSFGKEGTSHSNTEIADTLAPTSATVRATAEANVTRKFLLATEAAGNDAGTYVISTESTADIKITHEVHPLFSLATQKMNLGRIAAGKIVTLLETKIGSCGSESATVENGHAVMVCGSRGGFGNTTRYINQSTLPKTIGTRTVSLEAGVVQVSLRAAKTARSFSVSGGLTEGGYPNYCSQSCSSYHTIALYPQLAGFYPRIINV